MRDRSFFIILWFLLWLVGISGPSFAQKAKGPYHPSRSKPADSPTPPAGMAIPKTGAPPIKLVSPGVFEIGGAVIRKKDNRVEFPAVVNMNKGLLEYLIVGEGGKVHESLLRTAVEPYALQIALLMLGLEGTTNPLKEQGDPRRPEGDPVSIHIRWENEGKEATTRIEQWVLNKKERGPLKTIHWIFTGSFISRGVFMAQAEKSIVAIYHDPVAMIDNPLPEGASDEIWFVYEERVPPVGTKVQVIIQAERSVNEGHPK